MKPRAIRRTVIREWMTRPPENRLTEEQTLRFSKDAVQRYVLPRSNRTAFERIRSWLLPRMAKP